MHLLLYFYLDILFLQTRWASLWQFLKPHRVLRKKIQNKMNDKCFHLGKNYSRNMLTSATVRLSILLFNLNHIKLIFLIKLVAKSYNHSKCKFWTLPVSHTRDQYLKHTILWRLPILVFSTSFLLVMTIDTAASIADVIIPK